MKPLLTISLLCVSVVTSVAQDASVFTPPQTYPIERYEAGWSKNPFTLKTAPVVAEQASFTKDLALGSYYGSADNPTVVVVNTKTGERMPLKKGTPAKNGMVLKNFKYGSGRKDAIAEITLGNETAEVRYNDDYVKQVAAAEGTRAVQQQGQNPQQVRQQQPGGGTPIPGGGGRMVTPMMPQGQTPRPTGAPGTVTSVGNVSMPPMPQTMSGGLSAPVPATRTGTVTATTNTSGTGNGVTLNVSSGTSGQTNAALVSQNNSYPAAATPAPLPIRRRLIPPATGATP